MLVERELWFKEEKQIKKKKRKEKKREKSNKDHEISVTDMISVIACDSLSLF